MFNKVILQRKQPTPFTVYYPYGVNGITQEITWMGTQGKIINERPVSMDVFLWLKEQTRTFQLGALVIKETEDEDIIYEKENIIDIEEAEKSALTKEEILAVLEKGNHNALKTNLKALTEGKSEELVKEIRRQVVLVATEIGIDSSSKRKVLSDWAGIDFENSDTIFDKNIEDIHK